MPNQFGLETAQEAQARILQGFSDQRERFNNSGLSQNKYAVAGQSIANIFGTTIRKSLDTWSARKSEAERVVSETGVSVQEARQIAKDNVPRDFAAVRQAKMFDKMSKESEELQQNRQGEVGYVQSRIESMVNMASKLRLNGFATEATALSMQAYEMSIAEEARLAAIDKQKADLAMVNKNLKHSDHGELFELSEEELRIKEELTKARLESSSDPAEIEGLQRQLQVTRGRIAKLNYISMSDADYQEKLGKGANDKILLEILDGKVLSEELGNLEALLIDKKGSLASTTWGELGAWGAGILETWGIDPASIGADELIADVVELDGSRGFLSAGIRHALTGAAMSAAEQPLLEPFLALPGESISTSLAKVRVVKRYTDLDIATRQAYYESFKKDGVVPEALNRQLSAWQVQEERAIKKQAKEAKTPSNEAAQADVLSLLDIINQEIDKRKN